MRGYTIGSFLFWVVETDKISNFQFYEFIRNYHERDNRHNPKANITGDKDITSILDGQQRLTVLYIGLKGTYAYHLPWRKRQSDNAFPTRKLCLNLLSESQEFGLMYDFRFLTDVEIYQRDGKTCWFEVGKVLEFTSLQNINKYLRDNDLIENEFSEKCLFGLYEVVNEKQIINYYLEAS
jgi:Protein of unknown function DUF262